MKSNDEVNGSQKLKHEKVNGFSVNELKDFHKLFAKELKEPYWIEGIIKKLLHKVLKYTNSFLLGDKISRQLDFAKDHRLRIKEMFSMIDAEAQTIQSKSIKDLIDGAEELMGDFRKGVIRDAGIISSDFKMKHFGLASDGRLCFYARTLGELKSASILNLSLNEENLAIEKLSLFIESIRMESSDASRANKTSVTAGDK